MDSSTWIAIYLPMIMVLLIIPHQQSVYHAAIIKNRKKRGVIMINNELVKKYIGKRCKVSTGSFGVNIIGMVIDIKENWIEIETKRGMELVNLEFIQNIKVK